MRKVTQADKVLAHMKTRGAIHATTAIGIYGIQRLAAVIKSLRDRGVDINVEYKLGVNGSKYALYSLNTQDAK